MKKVRVLEYSCGLGDIHVTGDIIEMYSLEEIEEKDKNGELRYDTLNYCRNSIESHKDRVLGFVLYETVDDKEDYVWVDSNDVEILEDESKSKQVFTNSDLKTGDMFDKVDESNDKKILFAKMRDGAIIPSKREEDGCYDLYICTDEDVIIQPHQIKLIPTGICSTFPSKYRIGIRERGSNTKSGLITVAGQIDSNYTGEWFLALYNSHNVPAKISKEYEDYKITDEIVQIPYRKAQAQFAVELVPDVEVEEIELEYIKSLVTNRGAGCLGSSGK